MQVLNDFGRHRLNSKTPDSDMTLNLKGGGEIKVNSQILSLNSPVIERLVKTLEIKSLDVDDFEELAVRCFVDCVYTGGIDLLEMRIFRDVNGMADFFEVEWLVGKCEGYFTECLAKSETSDFDEILTLVKNAWFAHEDLKKDRLWTLVIETIRYLGLLEKVVSHFIPSTEAFKTVPTTTIDMLVSIAGVHGRMWYIVLLQNLKKSEALSRNAKYLLQKLDLTKCISTDKEFYSEFFSRLISLNSPSIKDNKLISKLHFDTVHFNAALRFPIPLYGFYNHFDANVLFRPLDLIFVESFEDFHTKMTNKAVVRSLYNYFDYFFTWLESHQANVERWSENWTRSICELAESRRWSPVAEQYIQSWGLPEQLLEVIKTRVCSIPQMSNRCDYGVCGLNGFDVVRSQHEKHTFQTYRRTSKKSNKMYTRNFITTSPVTDPEDPNCIQVRTGYGGKWHVSVYQVGHRRDQTHHVDGSEFNSPSKIRKLEEGTGQIVSEPSRAWSEDEIIPVPRKACFQKLVKRSDIFGGGDVWKMLGHNGILLTEKSYISLILYGVND